MLLGKLLGSALIARICAIPRVQKARLDMDDKFQSQEAPVAIHSLTASDGVAAPQGLGFLLEPNRPNVAISRAECLSNFVGSPGLTTGIANTVEEAEQINRLYRITESP